MISRSKIQSYCGNDDPILGCSYWNPSIFPLNSHQYLIAVRESTRQNCGGMIGTMITLARLAFRPAISTVLIGSFNPNDLIIKSKYHILVRVHQQLPDSFRYNPNGYHRGHEDPKWISDEDRLYLLTSSERYSCPRLFLTRVTLIQHQIDNNTNDDLIEFGKTIELRTLFDAPYSQKNWMHVPVSMKDKPKKHHHWLLFVYQVSPTLQLVWVDPETGNTVLYDDSLHSLSSVNEICGSSMFISETNNTYLGFIHTSKPHPASHLGLDLNIYHSYLIRLTRKPIPTTESWKWIITHKTPPLAMPVARNERAHRIQFVTTLTQRNSEFWISMGDMDCDSHILRIPQRSLLQLLH
ncbi:unnamed protein product [Rotaria sp. Silwood2]|nr:unnamed protein product [Rotaria sp. Silwood2]CAF2883956.1 unnamed protein product [Rotaria sp. Silwood2]CAF3423132.1 unnamed protein product [Rotaria sp. Silwood2]CAF4059238.1 unnamed protein product [Rotaria sp. Silwood2]CAF4194370.1 unnamed protein product [Rotaria sp. Silwood2]